MTSFRIANAPCSWGVLEFDLEGERKGFARVLDEMAQAGYAGTELGDWGFMPTDPDLLCGELEQRRLEMVAAFVPVALANRDKHDEGLAVAKRTASMLASVSERPLIVLADDNGKVPERVQNAGRVTPSMGLSDAQWRTFADGADRIAREVLQSTGIRTVFHHHCAGYVETPAELDMLLELTDPALLGLCFDTGHYHYGGGDALDGLCRYGHRVWHVHFKDCQLEVAGSAARHGWDYFEAVRQGVFCELGEGAVDFKGVLGELEQMQYEGWIVVEQDVLPGMGSPLEAAQRNRQYLRGLGL